jgi:hypothetical protein
VRPPTAPIPDPDTSAPVAPSVSPNGLQPDDFDTPPRVTVDFPPAVPSDAAELVSTQTDVAVEVGVQVPPLTADAEAQASVEIRVAATQTSTRTRKRVAQTPIDRLPLDYLLQRPRRIRAKRRLPMPQARAVDPADFHSQPQLRLPPGPDVIPARSEQTECVLALSDRDPNSALWSCVCVTCVCHGIKIYRNEPAAAVAPRTIRFRPLPGVVLPLASPTIQRELVEAASHCADVLVCSCERCMSHRLLMCSWRQVQKRSIKATPPAVGGCRDFTLRD